MALAKPALSFTNDPNTGIYWADPDQELRNEYPDLMEAWIQFQTVTDYYIRLVSNDGQGTDIVLSDAIKEARDIKGDKREEYLFLLKLVQEY